MISVQQSNIPIQQVWSVLTGSIRNHNRIFFWVMVMLGLPGSAVAGDMVDPFAGESMAIEQTKADVSLVKAQNELLEEQTKKARFEFMLKNADRLFAAELKKRLEATSPGPAYGSNYPGVALPEPLGKSPIKHSGMAGKLPLMPAKKVATIGSTDWQTLSGPHLIGVLGQTGKERALVRENGKEYQLAVGQVVPGMGELTEVGHGMAVIGGQRYRVDRMPVSDVDRQDINALAKMVMNQSGGAGGAMISSPLPDRAMTGIPPAAFNP